MDGARRQGVIKLKTMEAFLGGRKGNVDQNCVTSSEAARYHRLWFSKFLPNCKGGATSRCDVAHIHVFERCSDTRRPPEIHR